MLHAIWVLFTLMASNVLISLCGSISCQRKRRFDPTAAPPPLGILKCSPNAESILIRGEWRAFEECVPSPA